jgi:thiamine monophosphate kinase
MWRSFPINDSVLRASALAMALASYGAIAAANSLSDVWAMGGRPCW